MTNLNQLRENACSKERWLTSMENSNYVENFEVTITNTVFEKVIVVRCIKVESRPKADLPMRLIVKVDPSN